MSAIAIFTLVPLDAIDQMKRAAVRKKKIFGGVKDDFPGFLKRVGREVLDYPWSGYLLLPTLEYLERAGIDLIHSQFDELAKFLCEQRQSSVLILTRDHAEKHLAKFTDDLLDEAKLRELYKDSERSDDAEGVQALSDSVQIVGKALKVIDENSLLLLQIY